VGSGAAYALAKRITEDPMSEKNRLNVLVVDPDEGTVLDLKDMISELGYRVSSNTNPEAVIEEIKHGTFQIVIADVSPPADRALDLLARMRAADSDLCVISMTAMPTVDVAVRAMKQHAFDYLQKPVEFEELRHVIDAAIREKGLLVDVETRLNQIVGKRLRERRSESTLTLKQLANRTGLSVSLISQIELGKSAASMSTLYKLATALQVRMTYFFETV
jgi:DNA-binding NtrC family response regulator